MACFSRHSAAKVKTTRTGEVNTSNYLRDVACSDHSKLHRIASPVSSLNWSTLARKGGDIIVMFCKQYTYVGWELWSGEGDIIAIPCKQCVSWEL